MLSFCTVSWSYYFKYHSFLASNYRFRISQSKITMFYQCIIIIHFTSVDQVNANRLSIVGYHYRCPQELVTWTNAETSIPQSTQTFSTSVHTLLVTRSNSAPLVVLSNGTVCVAGEETKPRKSKQRTEWVTVKPGLQYDAGAYVVSVASSLVHNMTLEFT